MKLLVTEVRALRDDGDLTSENCTVIGLADLGGGAFVTIKQPWFQDLGEGVIGIDANEWEAIRTGIEQMFAIAESLNEEARQEDPSSESPEVDA